MLRSVTVRPVLNTLKTAVRHGGGGGGRPGGRPAFNWKEKKLLKIGDKPKQVKVRPYGEFSELEQFFDASRGDVIIPFEEEEKDSNDPRLLNAMKLESDKKRVNMRNLFGSSKSFGLIPKKEVPAELKKYNYERIFGKKHRKRAAEKAAA